MRKLLALLAIAVLLVSYIPQAYSQDEGIWLFNTALVMIAFECDYDVTATLLDYGMISYIYLAQYYMPNVPQVYCFDSHAIDNQFEYMDMALTFIMQYNDYVVLMFEDELWNEEFAQAFWDSYVGDDDIRENVTCCYGFADIELGIVFMQFMNNQEAPYGTSHSFSSITMTHELAHLILHDYGYGPDVYIDWVHSIDEELYSAETTYKIFSPVSNQWYEVFERYPVEEDF